MIIRTIIKAGWKHGAPKYLLNQLKQSSIASVLTLTCQIIVQQILLFFWEKNTYTTLLGPTRLLISDIFLSKPYFHLHKREKNPSYTALLGPTRLLISEKSATYTIKWSYLTFKTPSF